MQEATTTAVNWDRLADSIADGKCVLFIGPGATVNYGDPGRQHRFFQGLRDNPEMGIYSYLREDGLFVFGEERNIYDVCGSVRKFYEADYSSPMLEKLARIPFHLIVSLTPDTALEKEMKQQGFRANSAYYEVLREQNPELPTPETPPLLYYLLGTSTKVDSLIISHSQMYKYIRSLLGGIKLPDNLKTALNQQNAKNLVFLGVDFDKWYFQLILNMLGIDASSYKSFASAQQGGEEVRTIWESHFKINFVPHQIEQFVDGLYACVEGRGELRSTGSPAARQRSYLLPNIIRFLTLSLDGTGLEIFCQCYYTEVYDDFSPQQSKSERISKLVDFVRKTDGFEPLLELMKDENPVQFEKNLPYFNEQ